VFSSRFLSAVSDIIANSEEPCPRRVSLDKMSILSIPTNAPACLRKGPLRITARGLPCPGQLPLIRRSVKFGAESREGWRRRDHR
jgi:hypothetical protein